MGEEIGRRVREEHWESEMELREEHWERLMERYVREILLYTENFKNILRSIFKSPLILNPLYRYTYL